MKDLGCFDYQITRRRMLQTSGASILGMPVARLIAASGRGFAPKAEHVILFWNGGGMSHVDTWDPKPGRPVQGEFTAIDTSAEGVQISSIFPNLAKQMHNCSLIRSIAGTNGAHGRATYELQTSYNMDPSLIHPGLGSIVVHEKNRLGDLPGFITINGQAAKSGYFGQSCAAYFIGEPGEKDPYLSFPAGISNARGNKRLDLLAKMNTRATKKTGALDFKATDTAVKEAVSLMKSPALKVFDLKNEKPDTLARYGDSDFGRGALLARKLVETGVRFVQVNRGGFDTHSNNFPAMENHGLEMDPALASLVEDLRATGKLDSTLVLVLSEFGRTPRINNNAGRDHHARCFSCLVAGGGIKGGIVVGASDKDAMEPADRPVKPSDIHATVCHALGIDHEKEVYTRQDRPMVLVRDGAEPVRELFG